MIHAGSPNDPIMFVLHISQAGLSDLTSPEEVNAIILAEEGAVVAFISRAYEASANAAAHPATGVWYIRTRHPVFGIPYPVSRTPYPVCATHELNSVFLLGPFWPAGTTFASVRAR